MRCARPAFIPVVRPDGRFWMCCVWLMTIAQECRIWRGFPCNDDAPLVAHPDPAVQPFQDFYRRTGIAGAFRRGQQLECPQLEPHRVVPVHLPAVLEAQDLFQAPLRVQTPQRWLRALWGNAEAPVEPRHKLIEHRLCQPVWSRSRPRRLYPARLIPSFLRAPDTFGGFGRNFSRA